MAASNGLQAARYRATTRVRRVHRTDILAEEMMGLLPLLHATPGGVSTAAPIVLWLCCFGGALAGRRLP